MRSKREQIEGGENREKRERGGHRLFRRMQDNRKPNTSCSPYLLKSVLQALRMVCLLLLLSPAAADS